MSDVITIEILEDGTIKMETNKVSMPNHGNAEMLLRELVTQAGGSSERKMKKGCHQHTHDGENFHSH